MKTFLSVSYEEKEAAKALGARWDPQEKKWYAPPGTEHVLTEKWPLKIAPKIIAPPPVFLPKDKITYLSVPFEKNEEAKALGAIWDPQEKKWCAPPGTEKILTEKWPLLIISSASLKFPRLPGTKPTSVSQEQHNCYWIRYHRSSRLKNRNNKTRSMPENFPLLEITSCGIPGKWMVFASRNNVDAMWEKVKEGVDNHYLYDAKVSTSNLKDPNKFVIIVYTPDCKDLKSIIQTLDYLEHTKIHDPTDGPIYYKSDSQTSAGIYAGSTERPWLYASNTIREYQQHLEGAAIKSSHVDEPVETTVAAPPSKRLRSASP